MANPVVALLVLVIKLLSDCTTLAIYESWAYTQIGTVLACSAAAIAIGLTEPLWSVGRARLVSSYCMFQEGTFVPAELTLSIGLTHYNVSYENVAITASTVIDPEVSMTKGFAPGKLQ